MKMLLFILFLTTQAVHGQSKFNYHCEEALNNSEQTYKIQFNWLKDKFKTRDCAKIHNQLQKLKSFSLIFPNLPEKTFRDPTRPLELIPFEVRVRYLQNSEEKTVLQNEIKMDMETLVLFKEFRNLQHISLTEESKFNICDLLKEIPHINTITLDNRELTNQEMTCITKGNINLYFAGNFSGLNYGNQMCHLIIGIENFIGPLSELRQYKNLSYVGFEYYEESNDLHDLALMRKLTNLHINTRNIYSIDDIARLINLKYLTINCFENEVQTIERERTTKCAFQKIRSLNFLKKLPYLEGIDFGWNSIERLEPILFLKKLKYLNLRNNNISILPDLSTINSLEVADFSGNQISDVGRIQDRNIKYFFENNPILKGTTKCPKSSPNTSIKKLCNSD